MMKKKKEELKDCVVLDLPVVTGYHKAAIIGGMYYVFMCFFNKKRYESCKGVVCLLSSDC